MSVVPSQGPPPRTYLVGAKRQHWQHRLGGFPAPLSHAPHVMGSCPVASPLPCGEGEKGDVCFSSRGDCWRGSNDLLRPAEEEDAKSPAPFPCHPTGSGCIEPSHSPPGSLPGPSPPSCGAHSYGSTEPPGQASHVGTPAPAQVPV